MKFYNNYKNIIKNIKINLKSYWNNFYIDFIQYKFYFY